MGVLITASLIFYGSWRVWALAVLASSILVNMSLGMLMLRYPARQRPLLTIGIVFNLGLLGYFKYTNFFLENAGYDALSILMPIGLSFITFQKIAFLMDIRRGHITQIRPLEYILFASFFPQLIAGPIVHYREVVGQFVQKLSVTSASLSLGFSVFILGLAKKTFLADSLAPYANLVYQQAANGIVGPVSAWLGALAYTFQLYFDFSGYCDMAVGLGLMLGIMLPINFLSPYKSRSIIEFWRRWHITLSNFLRDYIYIPLGGNRVSPLRQSFNLWAVMLLGGLWHGAAWTFVAWGALHGAYLVINHNWNQYGRPLTPALAHGLTFLAVVIGWVVFRAPDFMVAERMFSAMFLVGPVHIPLFFMPAVPGFLAAIPMPDDPITYMDAAAGFLWVGFAAAIALFTPTTMTLYRLYAEAPAQKAWHACLRSPVFLGIALWLGLAGIFTVVPSPFLYFQF